MSDELRLTAWLVSSPALHLVPAPVRRAWMDATDQKFANRCLPLLLASQSGWWMTSRHRLRAAWNGGTGKEAVTVEALGDDGCGLPCPAISHFGHGVLTWNIPWLFRLPAGWNLLARGPANEPKDGICALEGLTEADWAPMTFTMNYLFTAPDVDVFFEIGEPVGMLVPQRRGELEEFAPEIRDIAENPELGAAYAQWSAGRDAFNARLAVFDPAAVQQGWQRDYFRGHEGPGDHQVKRRLRPFAAEASPV